MDDKDISQEAKPVVAFKSVEELQRQMVLLREMCMQPSYEYADMQVGQIELREKEIQRLQKIEKAAKITFAHLSYLENCGVLTRKEDPMMQALKEALVCE